MPGLEAQQEKDRAGEMADSSLEWILAWTQSWLWYVPRNNGEVTALIYAFVLQALRMSLEEEQARQRANEQASSGASGSASLPATAEANVAPSSALAPTAPQQQATSVSPAGKGSLVADGAESITGTGKGADDQDEEAMLARALALSQQSQDTGDVEMSTALQSSSSVANENQPAAGDQAEEEELTEEEAIARAIEMSLQSKKE